MYLCVQADTYNISSPCEVVIAVRIDKRWHWMLLALLVATVIYAARQLTRPRLPIRATQVRRGNIASLNSTDGIVEPQAIFAAMAPYSGIVKAVYVREGALVPKGKLLVAMNDTEGRTRLATALTGLRTAEANYDSVSKGGSQQERNAVAADIKRLDGEREQAAHRVVTLKKLELQGASSRNEIDSAQQQLDGIIASLHSLDQRMKIAYAPVDLERARAALADAQAAYAAAKEVESEISVYAPYEGTVYALPVAAGQFVQRGDKLVQMADFTKVQVRAYFDEPDMGQLAIGMPISIRWEALPGRTWSGHIIQLPASIVTYETRHVGAVIISVDNTDRRLLPETNVIVTVTMSKVENVLEIPREALYLDRGNYFVYSVHAEKLVRTPIKVGINNLSEVQILDGLHEGETVAVGSNGQSLGDGLSVTLVH
jgi:HlyD family secretion protein